MRHQQRAVSNAPDTTEQRPSQQMRHLERGEVALLHGVGAGGPAARRVVPHLVEDPARQRPRHRHVRVPLQVKTLSDNFVNEMF